MKKLLLIILLLMVTGIGVYSIIAFSNSSKLPSPIPPGKPPSPVITVGDIIIPTEQGTYCWSGFMNAICVDMISPPGIVKNSDLKPVIVSPEAKLNISFKDKPKANTLTVTRWINDEEMVEANLKGNTLIVPKEKGVYIYDVHARWEKGDSTSVFVIEVQ
ncbi:hypothetical protein ABET41_12530 [Metabacillus fastidiosus]|uniref:Uncharacterized protein n=1 Tax=Metabacillus fastidiosus TaxID=1458 RepID=A0ABU6NYP1_9BACI|nr:hypothetical protein [Metabacillus fastidiosus]MED4402237.1 hypothetical protein [Metabacillus fastidiosus]MED4462107.1 hypothetical protein [Metabacillus fastidiosus]